MQKDPSKTEIDTPIVGIGYSAGGLEAVRELLAALPINTGMAFVVIQHLKPDEESHLADILSKCTDMKVKVISNGLRVESDIVYVVPPGFDVVLAGDFLNLNQRGKSTIHHLGIDFFFSSLSQSRKSKAIGVVLSGSGGDGTLGLKAIKSEGGITIVQDPKTAKFDSMPRSAIATSVADLVLSPKLIARELERFSKHPYTLDTVRTDGTGSGVGKQEPPTESNEDSFLSKILGLLLDQTKIDFSKYKLTTIERRIHRQMMIRKIETIDKYVEYLKKNSDEVKALYEDIFIHVTDFFRDPESFDALAEKVFPVLIKDRSPEEPLRLWIPGCATGEEVYSLAISLTEFLEQKSLRIPLNIFAGDISEPAIQRARKGTYADYQMRNVSEKRLEEFFEPIQGGYKVKKSIRDLCIFSRHDITTNPPIPKVDLISCRNVLIYFSTDLQKRVFPVFHYALNEKGFLWLGRAENPDASSKLFFPVDKTHKIFSKASVTQPIQARFSTNTFAPTPSISQVVPPVMTTSSNEPSKNVDQVLLHRYSPPSVVVNSNLDIIQFKGRTTPYLEPPTGTANYNLLKMANPELASPLRLCVQTANRGDGFARKENVTFEVEGQSRHVNIDISCFNPSAPSRERQYLIVFEDGAFVDRSKAKLKSAQTKGKNADENQNESLVQYNAQLQQDLEIARDYQQSLVEEYEAAQEELTSTNEELRSTNEELQSTNEELHSTNEELGTAKEELQATNEELLSTNDELQKRNSDLEGALKELEISEERFRLMIAGVKDYAIFMLDPEGNVATWNEGAKRLKGYEAREIIGQHFSRFYPEADKDWKPKQEMETALKAGQYEEEGWRVRKNGTRFWASVLITTIRNPRGQLVGFSKVTRDLTDRKKNEEELRKSEERFRLLVTEVKDYAIFLLDTEGNIASWNEGARRIKGYEASEIIGKHFSTFYTEEDIRRGHPQEELKIVLRDGRYEEEGWRVKKDGFKFWANVVITRLNDPRGTHIGFAKVTRDLTERRRAEEKRNQDERQAAALRQTQENERVLDQIFSEAPSFMTLLSVPDFRYLKSNAQHLKLLRKNDIVGKTVLEADPELESQGIIDLLNGVVRSGEPFVAKEFPVHFGPVGDEPAITTYLDFVYQPLRNSEGKIYAIAAQGYDVTEKVLTRKAVENERENFRRLFKQTPEMVCILRGPNHIFEFVNEAHVKALGFNATGKSLREAQPESVEVHGILDDVYNTGKTAELFEIPVTVGDRLRYFNLTYSARLDEAGKIIGVMILGVEVTDQVESRNQLKNLADSISHIVWVTDSTGNVVYYNKRWHEFTGISLEDSKDISVWQSVIDPRDFERVSELWQSSIKDKQTFETEWRMKNKKGTYRWHLVRTVPSYDSHGKVVGWYGTSTDIDEEKRAREANKLFADAGIIFAQSLDVGKTLQSLANLIVERFADWCSIHLVQQDQPPREMAVAHPDPLYMKKVQKLFRDYPTDWSAKNGAANVLRTGQSELYSSVSQELLKAQAKDEKHWKLIKELGIKSGMVVPLVARGNVLGVINIISSESGRLYDEKDLSVAEDLGRRAGLAIDSALLFEQSRKAVKARDSFLSIASHELKTPLTSLKLQTQMRKRNISKGDLSLMAPKKISKMLNDDERQIDRLTRLVEDMLDISKLASGKLSLHLEKTDLCQVVKEVVERFSTQLEAARVPISLHCPESIIGNWDHYRLEQIIINLLTNVTKYASGKPAEIKVIKDNKRAVLIVKDNGIGISQVDQKRVFEQFERAVSANEASGLGLGLYIVKQLVESHGGTVSLQSELGDGSEFKIELPVETPSSRNT